MFFKKNFQSTKFFQSHKNFSHKKILVTKKCQSQKMFSHKKFLVTNLFQSLTHSLTHSLDTRAQSIPYIFRRNVCRHEYYLSQFALRNVQLSCTLLLSMRKITPTIYDRKVTCLWTVSNQYQSQSQYMPKSGQAKV